MKILIIRHAEPDYSIDSLTAKGWREAHLLSDRLANMNIRDFYTSPLGRAQHTAQPTLERLGQKAEVLPWLREFSGTVSSPFETRRRIPWNLMPQYWTRDAALFDKDRWHQTPLMSTGDVPDVYRQAGAGMDALLLRYGYERDGYLFRCADNGPDTIALFCHFGLGMALLSHMLGAALPVIWQGFFLPPASITTLITEERVRGEVFFKCLSVGDTSHLYAANEPVSRSGLFPECYDEAKKDSTDPYRRASKRAHQNGRRRVLCPPIVI